MYHLIKPNIIISISIVSLFAYTPTVHSKTKTITEILQEYCVPASINYCSEKATYTNGKCECGTLSKYYDVSSRSCKNCIDGSFASNDRKSCEAITCPSGYVATLITDGKCPSGYSLTQVKSGACPSGYGLKEYVISTKSWK